MNQLNDFVPRGPLRDSIEVERFDVLVRGAHQQGILRRQCEPVAQFVGAEVLVYCLLNSGGPPGKRYKHAPGWLDEFERDLRDCYFLAM